MKNKYVYIVKYRPYKIDDIYYFAEYKFKIVPSITKLIEFTQKLNNRPKTIMDIVVYTAIEWNFLGKKG